MNVNLTHRELTLIRVALISRLDKIKNLAPESYEESRTLLNGKLWDAVKTAAKQEGVRA
jgi:hypothetical protein